MAARRVGALACLACLASSAEERRRFPDEEVIASQRYFSRSWRDHFNRQDAQYCGNAFLENASVHAAFGPIAADLKRLVGLPDPEVSHGRGAITRFWNETMIAGLKELQAHEEKGDLASAALAVDDDTVILTGKMIFNNAVHGQIFSETWVRAGEEWKLKSMMFAIQEVASGFTLSATVPAVTVAPAAPAAELPKATAESTTAAPTVSASASAATGAVPTGAPPNTNATAAQQPNAATPSGSASSPPSSSGSSAKGPILLLVVSLISGIAALLLRHSRKRREATIVGFEAMLG